MPSRPEDPSMLRLRHCGRIRSPAARLGDYQGPIAESGCVGLERVLRTLFQFVSSADRIAVSERECRTVRGPGRDISAVRISLKQIGDTGLELRLYCSRASLHPKGASCGVRER